MKITNDIVYVGVFDKKIDLFEGQYKVPDGISYNSYVILDESIAVMDTVDAAYTHEWLDNVQNAIGDKKPSYLIIQHMEPDHSANIMNFLKVYPEVKIVTSKKALAMINNFFATDLSDRTITVGEGDVLPLGYHELHFISAPMVHWPEVTVTYDATDKVLFSADGFGRFGDTKESTPWADEARRYYIGIVGKYGAQVQSLLKKAAGLDIEKICPLHGPVLTKNLGYYIGLYNTWASYTPEDDGITVAYTSIYGNTAKAVARLVERLKSNGAPSVAVYDLARCDVHAAVADAFRYGTLVLATTTYNAGVFPYMREFIAKLSERGFKNRTVGLIENGSWAPMAAREMQTLLSSCKDITYAQNTVSILSAPDAKANEKLDALADELCREYIARAPGNKEKNDPTALFNIGYGLYVITSNDGKRDNGLIVNTVTQVTNTPNRLAVTINKENYSHHIIKQTGTMNINCLTVDAPFKVFESFGFRSGRNVNKFEGCDPLRSENGLVVLPRYINSFMSLSVTQYVDLGTHGMFICDVTESRVISDRETMTYTYYHKNVKPKPELKGKRGYVCKICGFVYDETDELPDDYICPLCKHGAQDFEPIEA